MHHSISEEHMLPCMWKATTGMECPGCGTQRSIAGLLDGRVLDSFVLFPALVPLLFLFVSVPLRLKFASRFSTDWIVSLFIISAFVMFGAYFLRYLPV